MSEINEYDDDEYFEPDKTNGDGNASIMQLIVEPNTYLDTLKKQLEGKNLIGDKWEKESEEVAPENVITFFIAEISSFMNPREIISSVQESSKLDLKYEGLCDSMQDYLENQPTLSGDDISLMMDIFRNCCETAKNLTLSGHGAEIISKILNGGIVERISTGENKGGVLGSLNPFGGNKN